MHCPCAARRVAACLRCRWALQRCKRRHDSKATTAKPQKVKKGMQARHLTKPLAAPVLALYLPDLESANSGVTAVLKRGRAQEVCGPVVIEAARLC